VADALTRTEVERIAALASLALTDAELDAFTRQLADVLAYARQIQELDTSGVPPTAYVLTRRPVDRPDEPAPPLDRSEVLAAAADAVSGAGLFRVPRVIG
jgi:aspartyl-tRNA(Asn)/glutamyl-tRNA(Gln) amidotransferase subunit C